MVSGDRVVILKPNTHPSSTFQGWAVIADPAIGDDPWDTHIFVHFDHIPPNNTYGYPREYVHVLYVIEEMPG